MPWAQAVSRFTAVFEALVIAWLREGSISAVARRAIAAVELKRADGIMQRGLAGGARARRLDWKQTHPNAGITGSDLRVPRERLARA